MTGVISYKGGYSILTSKGKAYIVNTTEYDSLEINPIIVKLKSNRSNYEVEFITHTTSYKKAIDYVAMFLIDNDMAEFLDTYATLGNNVLEEDIELNGYDAIQKYAKDNGYIYSARKNVFLHVVEIEVDNMFDI